MKIYTKTGDEGETGLYKGGRVKKDSALICALGDIDELNSVMGVCRAYSTENSLANILITVQKDLMALSAELAGADSDKQVNAEKLENWIDELSEGQPEQHDFVIPGDGKEGAYFHMARSVCRRAERSVVSLNNSEDVNPEIMKYLNRLSDLLFVMGRLVEDNG